MWNGYEVGMVMALLCYEVGGRTGRESGVGLMGSEVMCCMEFFFFQFFGVSKVTAWGHFEGDMYTVLISALACSADLLLVLIGSAFMILLVCSHSDQFFVVIISFMINLFVTTVFAKSFYGTDNAEHIGLVNAGQYLEEKYGGGLLPILYIWGIGLLAAGQSSTLTGTYAGQFIMGGFLNLRLKKWLRALITRSCAIIPTVIVSLIFNRSESSLDVLNEWLNVLQSVQIPFALIPLLYLVSKEKIMGTFKIGPSIKVSNGSMDCGWSVMVINGYLLLDFIRVEVTGMLFGSLVFVVIAPYVSFIIYPVSRVTGS
ncbi:hypothetical protein MKW92_025393 [Papaver armeniacum]|nr:hypothetical protein MKW92_025393 [Papaver armeniacum]